MAGIKERASREQETLMFDSAEKAREFVERVENRAEEAAAEGVSKKKEVTAKEVAEEFARYGEAVGSLGQPWEHSREEHDEVQKLVDTAFQDDLSVALKKAGQSKHYPRIIDLLHDVLTGQMYEIIIKREVNKQRLGRRQVVMIVGSVILLIIALSLMVFF